MGWRDQQALEAFTAGNNGRTLLARLPELLAGAPLTRHYISVS